MSRIERAVRRSRRFAAATTLGTDTIRVTRRSKDRGPMDAAGKYGDRPVALIYEGPGRIKVRSITAGDKREATVDRAVYVQTPELQLPVNELTAEVAPNDLVESMNSPSDPALEGRVFTITGRHNESHASTRRLPLVEGVRG